MHLLSSVMWPVIIDPVDPTKQNLEQVNLIPQYPKYDLPLLYRKCCVPGTHCAYWLTVFFDAGIILSSVLWSCVRCLNIVPKRNSRPISSEESVKFLYNSSNSENTYK
jgi:hypothetical protein